MDYSALALNSTWTEHDVSFANEEEAYKYFKFMRESIMDSKVYVNKVIGFDLSVTDMTNSNGERNVLGSISTVQATSLQQTIARNPNMCENNIELSNIFKHYLFLDPKVTTYRIKVHTGINTVDDNPFLTLNKEVAQMLTPSKYICKGLGGTEMPFYLTLHTEYGIDYKSMADINLPEIDEMNHKIHCFPLNVSFNIMEYIKILPIAHVDNKVHYRLENGMTPEILGDIFTNYITKLNELK